MSKNAKPIKWWLNPIKDSKPKAVVPKTAKPKKVMATGAQPNIEPVSTATPVVEPVVTQDFIAVTLPVKQVPGKKLARVRTSVLRENAIYVVCENGFDPSFNTYLTKKGEWVLQTSISAAQRFPTMELAECKILEIKDGNTLYYAFKKNLRAVAI